MEYHCLPRTGIEYHYLPLVRLHPAFLESASSITIFFLLGSERKTTISLPVNPNQLEQRPPTSGRETATPADKSNTNTTGRYAGASSLHNKPHPSTTSFLKSTLAAILSGRTSRPHSYSSWSATTKTLEKTSTIESDNPNNHCWLPVAQKNTMLSEPDGKPPPPEPSPCHERSHNSRGEKNATLPLRADPSKATLQGLTPWNKTRSTQRKYGFSTYQP